ncbi:MAG: YciI family protein [Myxococcales bacterium]|nr:YciI family protein [Myxococcales bacterium]
MKVMMFAKAPPHSQNSQPPSEEALLAMHRFNQELERAGVLVDLGGLMPGVRLKYSEGKCTVIDGPFVESKELIAGYSLLEVGSLAEAVEWAKRAPFGLTVADGEEAEVEIRPLFDPSTFDVPGEAEERARRLAGRGEA